MYKNGFKFVLFKTVNISRVLEEFYWLVFKRL